MLDDDAVWLIMLAGAVASMAAPLVERRRFVLEAFVERLDADAGWWAWGQGVPGKSQVTPLAFIHAGYSPDALALHVEAALQPEMDTLLRSRVMPSLADAKQNTHLFDQLIPDPDWYGSGLYRHYYTRSGLDRQLNSVRYFEDDYFSNANFCRRVGRPAFGERERSVLDAAMAGVADMHVTASEAVPPDLLNALTARQRTVMLMLLDGQSRKHIAFRLGISTHTVNEHIKQLYSRFGVNSIGELGARFLQSRA